MKIIQGSLQEVVYQNPTLTGNPADMKVKKSTHYKKDEIAYISDDIGLHEVINNDPDDVAISLHRELCTITHVYTDFIADWYGYSLHPAQRCRLWLQHLRSSHRSLQPRSGRKGRVPDPIEGLIPLFCLLSHIGVIVGYGCVWRFTDNHQYSPSVSGQYE